MITETYQDRRGKYRWRAKSGGRVIAEGGQGYSRKRDAIRAFNRFLDLIGDAVADTMIDAAHSREDGVQAQAESDTRH